MIIIGICGEPLSEKTVYINILLENLGVNKCSYLKLDNYKINDLFVPESYDFNNFMDDIKKNPKPIIILEGHFIFCDTRLMEMMTIKIYIDTIHIKTLINKYIINASNIKSGTNNYIIPSRKNADIIVYSNNNSTKSIELLVGYINNKL